MTRRERWRGLVERLNEAEVKWELVHSGAKRSGHEDVWEHLAEALQPVPKR